MYQKVITANPLNRKEEKLSEIPYVQLVRLRRDAERFLRDIDKAIADKDRK